MEEDKPIVPIGEIERSILLIRGQRVILDSQLAQLYGVSTRRLNEQVKRNYTRFPQDFTFQLTADEKEEVVAICDNLSKLRFYRGLPFVFTEHGALMAAMVLNSDQAAKVSVYVVRAFVKLREMLANSRMLAQRLTQLESKLQKHDRQIISLIEAIRQLMEPPPDQKRKPIGFASEQENGKDAEGGAFDIAICDIKARKRSSRKIRRR